MCEDEGGWQQLSLVLTNSCSNEFDRIGLAGAKGPGFTPASWLCHCDSIMICEAELYQRGVLGNIKSLEEGFIISNFE